MKMNILWNIRNILKKLSFCVFSLIVFCLVATEVAEAKTISNSVNFANTTQLSYFENLFKRSGYKYYILALDNSDNYYNDYYICLTNDFLDISNEVSLSSSCSEMYRYYRSNSTYNLVKYNDNTLILNNSVFYTSSYNENNNLVLSYLLGICICLFSFFLTFVLLKILGGVKS